MRHLIWLGLCIGAFAQVPRAEFPQPQFERSQWMTLNGSWDFEFDDRNVGLAENWPAGTRAFSKKIVVPFAPETKLSGIGDTGFHPFVWYKRTVTPGADWTGKRILLKFGAVDYRASVWVNGRMAGEHEGGNTPFSFDVTELWKAGAANTIVVRADDPPTDRYIPRGKQYWREKSASIFYTRTTGIWQPVWLEATGDAYVSKLRIKPEMSGLVRFETKLARPRTDLKLAATIRDGAQVVASGESQIPAGGAASLALTVPDPKRWDVGNPNLYTVDLEVKQGAQTIDKVSSYYGYRRVSVENGRVLLNGRPTYLKLVLDQGYWPDSTLTPPSDEAMQFDIKITKEMGFNGARKHQKVEDPRFLYWADKMGFLVSSEMANAYLFDEDYAARFTREWMECVERDVNHPSIIMWVPINESWGISDPNDVRQQNHLKSLYLLTKTLDPTRLVIDNDGWEHTDLTDLFAIHDYGRTGEILYEKYKDLGKPGAGVPDNARAAVIAGFKYNGTPVYLSEFGGIAYHMPGSPAPEGSWGYSGVEKSPANAFERMEGQWKAIARIPAIMGICYTQLTDVEQEINGLLTYDRKPKFDVKEMRRLNDMLR